MTSSFTTSRTSLRLGASTAALLIALTGAPVLAQTTPPTGPTTDQPVSATSAAPVAAQAQSAAQGDQSAEGSNGQDIVVTGTLFRRTDTETPSPVTVITADQLDKRGITTAAEAVQRLSANNAGALPNNFTAAGAFAAGASAVSLRGLTTSSTLVLFDGLRAAYYPLADDGTRNFVDLNTIPDAIIDRIEVLKDGASSTYGADAVAGVVNIITKKQFKGISGRAEAGISELGDAGNQRLSLTAGYGDLDEQGFNVYASGEYRRQSALRSSDRGYPYNTADLSRLCGPSGSSAQCRTNGIQNGINANGSYNGLGATSAFVVRPYNAANTAAIPGSRYQLVNPTLGCGTLAPVTLTAAQAASTNGATAAITNCQEDLRNEYNLISPQYQQLGGTIRATANLGEHTQFYSIFNYYQNKTSTQGASQSLRATTTPSVGRQTFSTATLALPVFVCPRGTTVACTAANGTLNPNNPFAALGQTARVVGRLNYPTQNSYNTQAYRFASGLNGSFGNDIQYSLEGTYMRETLKAKYDGYIFVQHLLDEVADGSFNFRNQALNSQATLDYLTPELINKSSSEVYQVQGSLAKALFDLPGGPLQVGIGAAYRHEQVISPSANPDSNGQANRYFTVNPFGATGQRNVKSAYFEVQAPVFDQLEINGSGRYDKYSSGQKNFSPKIGAKFTPVKQIAIRGTYSRGFRIPSFAESNGLPTTGFITVNPPASFVAAHGNDAYAQAYSLGLTSIGTQGLKPEKSRNFTGGVIIEPLTWLSFSADYYNIRKTNVIAGADYTPAINAYYAGQAVPAGLQVTQDVPDVSFPNAQPRIAFITYQFQNLNEQKTSGLDFTGEARIPLMDGIKLVSSLDATYVLKYTQSFPDGSVQRYDGTLGNYQITSASGTPKWRGSWQNTLDFNGKGSISGTAYYSGGYGEEAEDAGGTRGVCGSAPAAVYRDGSTVRCDVRRFIDVDLNGSINVADNFSLYANVFNVFNVKAPYDPTTYGGYNYNPAWASAGILGRAFSAGAKFSF